MYSRESEQAKNAVQKNSKRAKQHDVYLLQQEDKKNESNDVKRCQINPGILFVDPAGPTYSVGIISMIFTLVESALYTLGVLISTQFATWLLPIDIQIFISDSSHRSIEKTPAIVFDEY